MRSRKVKGLTMERPSIAVAILMIYMTVVADLDVNNEAILRDMCPGYQTCVSDNISYTVQPSQTFVTKVTDNSSQSSCCFPCSCDADLCRLRNNCCPSISNNHTKPETGDNSDNRTNMIDDNSEQQTADNILNKLMMETECIQTSLNTDRKYLDVNETKDWSVHHLNLGVFMVSQCMAGKNDTRCSSPDPTAMDETIPQTDQHGITYRNIYCAKCNSATDLSPWKVYVTCSTINIFKADNLLFPNSVEKMYKYAISAEAPSCGVDFMPPDDRNMTSAICLADENVISECNDSQANHSIVDACRTVHMPFVNSEENRPVVYANVFCYLCTIKSDPMPKCLVPVGLSYYQKNKFVGELNTDGDNETSFLTPFIPDDLTPAQYVPGHVNCTNNTVFDPYTRQCRKWYCPTGRMISGSKCIPVLNTVDKVTYRLDLNLEPDKSSMDNFNATNKTDIAQTIVDAIIGSSESIQTEIVILAEEPSVPYLYLMFLLKVISPTNAIKNLFDSSLYETKVIIPGIYGNMSVGVNFSNAMKLELSPFLYTNIIIIDMLRYTALRNIYKIDMDELVLAMRYPKINRLSFCTQILLTNNEMHFYVDTLDIRNLDIRLYSGEFVRTVDYDNARVCLSDYLRNVYDDMKPEPPKMYSPQAYLSIVCNLMSMVGLFITITTYLIFDELRSVPGKNNMMLSFHLLIAQSLYQFGMDKTDYPNACIVLGMLIHLFWLTAIFWMNACTLHMFRTFVTGQSYRSIKAIDPQVCGYAMYCYSVAVLMVAINTGISLYESGGKDFGYGARVCYISEPAMVGWTFALPVGIIIILNMSFFFAVVYQISTSTMRRRGKQTDRANTVIYMKLSSLTGVTWIFGYLYLWTDFVPLEYIFIVLNAGQGVFIFISFICTKRIIKLYRGLFRKCGRAVRESGPCECMKKTGETDPTAVDVNTGKVSLTAGSSSKGFLPSAFTKRTLKLASPPENKRKQAGRGRTVSNGANGVNGRNASNCSESDVFKESAAIAHALTKSENTIHVDRSRKSSPRTESESLSSDPDVNDHINKDIIATICHTEVSFSPNGKI